MKPRGKKWDRGKNNLLNIRKETQQKKGKRTSSLKSREHVINYNHQKRIAVSQQKTATQ
jgi:hypothetical protein